MLMRTVRDNDIITSPAGRARPAVCPGRGQVRDPSSLVAAAMLASLAHAPLDDQALRAVGRWFGGPEFRPIADVIDAALNRLIESGAVAAKTGGLLEITMRGRRSLRDFCGSAANPGDAAHDSAVLLALKVLPNEARAAVLYALIDRRQMELRQWRDLARSCPCQWPVVRMIMLRHAAMIEADIAVLARFARSTKAGPRDC